MGAFDKRNNIVVPDPDKPKEAQTFQEKWGWEAHEQVILRGVFTAADQEAVTNAATAVSDTGAVSVRAGSGRTATLERMILSWTLTGDGQPLPVTPSNIALLPANYSTPLLQVCDRLAAGMSKAEQKRFLDAASVPTPAN